jgi:hypothetical protein
MMMMMIIIIIIIISSSFFFRGILTHISVENFLRSNILNVTSKFRISSFYVTFYLERIFHI